MFSLSLLGVVLNICRCQNLEHEAENEVKFGGRGEDVGAIRNNVRRYCKVAWAGVNLTPSFQKLQGIIV